MILLELFWNFLVIGAVSFGGGYGMISLVRETVLGHCWLTESEFLSFIAVSESTPGPLAVNMATFIGASQAGLAGSFVATVGVVLPSFVIILLIAAALHSLMKYAGVNAFLAGVRPCVVAMILATACTMGLSTLGGFTTLAGGTGTLEEITEVISKLSLGQLYAPCILYDLNGYYQPLHQLLQQMITMGLSTPARQRNIAFAADLAQIRAILEK